MVFNKSCFKLVMVLIIVIIFAVVGCNSNQQTQNKSYQNQVKPESKDISKVSLAYNSVLIPANIKRIDNEYIVWAEYRGDCIPQGKGNYYYKPGGLCGEGFFEKGIPNGHGRLYFPSGEFAEGTFVNGKLTGKVILRYPDGIRQYQGEWDGYHRNGNGIQYNNLGEWVAKGTYENDTLLKGIIREFWHEEYDISELKRKHEPLHFEGEVINGKKNGFGKLYDVEERLEYEGGFKEDLFHGQGKLYKYDLGSGYNTLAYEGNWISGKRDGHGKGYYFMDGFEPIWFEGTWEKDEPVF